MPELNMNENEASALDATPTFEELGLSGRILDAIADMGYTEPTPVQAQAIPQVLAGHDVMAAAQTGTGKTAAFLLPSFQRLGRAKRGQGPLMLVVTPTRELAQQIQEVAESICTRTRHHTAAVVGGVSYEPQRAALKRGCDLLVATPGRLLDLINSGDCHLGQVKVLVLDEADRMLDMGFLPDMRKIVAQTPLDRQTLLFSATLDDNVLKHTRSLVHDPVRVEMAPNGTAADAVEQYVLGVQKSAKCALLCQLLQREGSKRVIVFTNGKHRADFLCRKLRKAGVSCAPIHGDRSQNQRQRALREFDEGKVDVLVATDVLARGIDVTDVSYVINYDVPNDEPESYIHRIGRTGRAGEEGWALTLVTSEDYLELRDVEQLMGKVIPDFPRAEDLELGEEPLVMDPDRDPAEKLPTKKARKRMAKQREAAAKAGAAAARAERREKGKEKAVVKSEPMPQPKAEAKPEPAAKPKPKRPGKKAARPEERSPKAQVQTQKPRRKQARKGNRPSPKAKAASQAEPFYRDTTAGKKQGRRHPGDHGGQR